MLPLKKLVEEWSNTYTFGGKFFKKGIQKWVHGLERDSAKEGTENSSFISLMISKTQD